MMTLLSILADIALGALAYRLALRVASTQEVMSQNLVELTRRVVHLENGQYRPSVGFAPIQQEQKEVP